MTLDRFLVKIDQDGKIVWKSENHRHLFTRFLQQFKDKEVFIEVNENRSKRSEMQNSLYWLYLGVIADDTGNNTEELHELFKGKFLSNGVKEILGEKVRTKKSTTKLSKGEFMEYLINIQLFTDIPIPNVDEYWGTYEIK